jgi:hypothetical protein
MRLALAVLSGAEKPGVNRWSKDSVPYFSTLHHPRSIAADSQDHF